MLEVRSKTIELDTPIKGADGVLFSTLMLRPPTVGDRRRAEFHLKNGTGGDAGTKFQVALMAACTGLTSPVIEELPMDVFNEGWEFLADFLVPAPRDISATP